MRGCCKGCIESVVGLWRFGIVGFGGFRGFGFKGWVLGFMCSGPDVQS